MLSLLALNRDFHTVEFRSVPAAEGLALARVFRGQPLTVLVVVLTLLPIPPTSIGTLFNASKIEVFCSVGLASDTR